MSFLLLCSIFALTRFKGTHSPSEFHFHIDLFLNCTFIPNNMTQKWKPNTSTIYWYLYLTLLVKEVIWIKYTVLDYFGSVSTLKKTMEIWMRGKEDCRSDVLQIKKFNLFSLSKWTLRSNLITVYQCFHLVKMFNGRGLANCVDDKVRKLNLLYARAKYTEA